MIDDGLSMVGLAVMRLWGDGISKGCLTLAELELDTYQDQHPCSSMGMFSCALPSIILVAASIILIYIDGIHWL